MFWLCRTCGVEQAATPAVCPICADERQWVPAEGQLWTTLAELAAEGTHTYTVELEAGLVAIGATPALGIGQMTKLVSTPEGSLLWDPSGFVDDAAIEVVRAHGPVLGIAASHPHMFGAQVEWSHRLGSVPVYVNAADADWVLRPDPVIRQWSGTLRLTESLRLVQVGGHFPANAGTWWQDGADGRTEETTPELQSRLPLLPSPPLFRSMFGAQVEWSHRLGSVPVYVNAADADWVLRPDPVIRQWSGTLRLTESLRLVQVGGHFPGNAVTWWQDGADGRSEERRVGKAGR